MSDRVSRQAIDALVPRPSVGIEILPAEIFDKILKLVVIDTVPIVDPIGHLTPCQCPSSRSHARIPKPADPVGRRTGKNELADNAIRDNNNLAQGQRVTRRGICPNILAVNKTWNRIVTKYLYEGNTFLFTNADALYCFTKRYPVNKIRHVQVLIQVRQWEASHQCHIARLADAQDFPDGPWYSKAMDPLSFWQSNGATFISPFQWLGTLEIRVYGWEQKEAINLNGTPYVFGTVFIDAKGNPVTLNPETAQLKLETRMTQPVDFVDNFDIWTRLTNMVEAGWIAEDIRITGCEAAESHAGLQHEVSTMSNEHPKIKFIKAVPKRARNGLYDIVMLQPWVDDSEDEA